MARNLPSLSSASSASVMLSRQCSSERKASLRSAIHFTGRPVSFAASSGELIFRIDAALHAEAAADIVGDHADFRLRNAEHLLRQSAPHLMRSLHRAAERVAVVARIVFGEAAARLHRCGRQAVDPHVVLDDVVGRGDGLLGRGLVAGLMEEGEVVGALLPHGRRAAARSPLRSSSPPAGPRIRPRSARRRPWPRSSVSAITIATGWPM